MADTEEKTEDAVEQVEEEDEPTSEEPSSQGDGQQPAELASQLMQNPQVLAALQDRLGSMVGGNSGYIQSLPKVVKRRIKALKKLQFEATKIEAEFYREVHRLECQYAAKYVPLVEKRATMVTGAHEPNDEEADWPSDDEKDDELAEDVKNKVAIEEKKDEESEKADEKEETKGIPGFWLTIFKNVDMLSEMIQPHDEAILNILQDVKVEFKEKDPMGFTLEFYFDTNEYFENKKLTKEYIMRSEPDETDPFSFEGPEIVKCHGCKIDWKKGKNVTVKTVKKKQKHKASGTTRTISKTVQSDSFFNFFNPPTPPDDEEMDEDTEALLAADFEIGHFIRERIVPRAVLYFTGEALENDDEFEDGEEEEGGEEGEYDEDADADYNPGKAKYISRAFQERCAQLALGRFSTPSSAPCDTRMLNRPNSGSAIRREVTVQTDISSRPTTAPAQSPHKLVNPDLDMNRSQTNTNAILDTTKPENRPKTVTFGRRIPVAVEPEKNLPEGRLLRERTEIILPNSLLPQTLDLPNADLTASSKIARENTFFHTPTAIPNRITNKNIAGQRQLHLAKRVVNTEEVITEAPTDESDEDENETLDQIQAVDHSSSIPVAKYAPKITPDAITPEKDFENNIKTDIENSKRRKIKVKQQLKRKQNKANVKNKDSDNGSTKIADSKARSILQRLTGKHLQPHKAGHVPSVNTRPKKKYTFSPPAEQGEADERVKVSESNPRNEKPGASQNSESHKLLDTRKTNNKTAGSATLKHVTSYSAGVRSQNDSKANTAKPVSAPPQKLSRSQNLSIKSSADTSDQSKPSSENLKAFPNPHSKLPLPKQLKEVTRTEHIQPVSSVPQRKGVRIQNALISTSIEESSYTETPGPGDNTSIASGHSGFIDIYNVHPKLQTSPYLRDNPLLQSGKRRRKPSAGLGRGAPSAE